MKTIIRKQSGLTTVEYAIGGALISLAIVGSFMLLGDSVSCVINELAGVLDLSDSGNGSGGGDGVGGGRGGGDGRGGGGGVGGGSDCL